METNTKTKDSPPLAAVTCSVTAPEAAICEGCDGTGQSLRWDGRRYLMIPCQICGGIGEDPNDGTRSQSESSSATSL